MAEHKATRTHKISLHEIMATEFLALCSELSSTIASLIESIDLFIIYLFKIYITMLPKTKRHIMLMIHYNEVNSLLSNI